MTSIIVLGNFISLVPGNLRYLGSIDLSQYFVKQFNIAKHLVPPDTDALRVDIVFSRRILATMLTTYMPTALLCFVCFSTNHFKAFYFEAIVTVNLTSLLVLTTLFISVSQSLPTTHYVKMIELWLLFCLMIPFAEVVIHTYIDSLREEVKQDIKKVIKKVAKVKKVKVGIPDVQPIGVEDEVQENTCGEGPPEKFVVVKKTQMRLAMAFAKYGIPTIFILFTIIYFIVGISM